MSKRFSRLERPHANDLTSAAIDNGLLVRNAMDVKDVGRVVAPTGWLRWLILQNASFCQRSAGSSLIQKYGCTDSGKECFPLGTLHDVMNAQIQGGNVFHLRAVPRSSKLNA